MSATFEELGRASITGSRSYSLKSRNVDQTFQIDVARPSSRLAEGQKLPVVYVLDGNGCFGLATQTARMLQDGGLAPSLIVGIGYRFDPARPLRAQYFETRTRDYTPTADETWLEMSKQELAKQGSEVNATTGGAPAFLRFIEEELKPFVAARYLVDEKDQTLTGMSLGGLFTLYAFFEAPQNFARYAAFSPSLWWDRRMLFGNEAALAARTKDVAARMFLSVGEQEEDPEGVLCDGEQPAIDEGEAGGAKLSEPLSRAHRLRRGDAHVRLPGVIQPWSACLVWENVRSARGVERQSALLVMRLEAGIGHRVRVLELACGELRAHEFSIGLRDSGDGRRRLGGKIEPHISARGIFLDAVAEEVK